MSWPVEYPPAILLMCTHTPKALLHCPDCSSVAKSCRRYSTTMHTWAVILYCQCSTQWIVCDSCVTQRTAIQLPAQRRYHHWSKHSETKSPPKKKPRLDDTQENSDPVLEPEENKVDDADKPTCLAGDLEEVSDDATLTADGDEINVLALESRKDEDWCCTINTPPEPNVAPPPEPNGAPQTSLATSFASDFVGTEHSKLYFQAEHRKRHGGVRDIVSKSQFGLTSMADDLTMTDVKYVTELAHFTHNLSRGQRQHLAKVLKMTEDKVKRDALNTRKRPWSCVVPTSYLLIRRQYTGYPESFLHQLPSPEVVTVGPFAYVSLRECVQNFLAYGYDLDTVPPDESTSTDTSEQEKKVTQITESAHCRRRLKEIKKMYSTRVLVLWILEWSDGYDPHGFSKKTRGSAWVKVITFVPPSTMNNSVLYTYPIALGPDTADPDLVEAKFKEELLELSNPSHASGNRFYYGKLKEFIQVHVELVASLMDQPERRSALHLIRGNSTLGARWGYVASLIAIKSSLVPCHDCSTRLFKNDHLWDSVPCQNCTQWNMDREDEKLGWVPTLDFPCAAMENQSELHHPKKLTFDMMKNAIHVAGEMSTKGTWTKANVEAYLADYCISNKMIAEILTKSENMRILKDSEASRLEKPDEYAIMQEMLLEKPADFEPVQCPPMWERGVEIHQHIDVIMHLVFLGAVSGTLTFVNTWLKQHNKFASFMRAAEQRLAGVKKLNLNWLKTMLFKGGKLGGWVSENYLGFSRVCKWFFLVLDDLEADEPEFVQPSTPPEKWLVKDNRGWLKARGLDESGLAAVLKARVQSYMTQEGGPPPLMEPPGGTVDEVYNMISAMSDMVGKIMVTSCGEEEIRLVDFAVKKFLTRFAFLDKKVNKNKKKKTTQWIASYTFPCLLNLAETMREFGPLKNYWEGGVRGEGFLRFMKDEHGTIMLRTNWEKLVCERVLQKKSLTCVSGGTTASDWAEEDVDEDEKDILDDHTYSKREFFKYPTDSMTVQDYMECQPLSVVRTSCGKYGMVTRNDQIVLLTRVVGTPGIVLRDMAFIHWTIHCLTEDGAETLSIIPLNMVTISYAFVMLPHPKLENWYCAVRSDWTEMDDATEFR